MLHARQSYRPWRKVQFHAVLKTSDSIHARIVYNDCPCVNIYISKLKHGLSPKRKLYFIPMAEINCPEFHKWKRLSTLSKNESQWTREHHGSWSVGIWFSLNHQAVLSGPLDVKGIFTLPHFRHFEGYVKQNSN
jgi:hypothetical protein